MIRVFVARHVMEIVLVASCMCLAIASPNFLTADNILAILRSASFQGVIAFGMTMVIIVGEIDLSVGANAAFAGCLVAWLIQARVPVAIAIPLTVACGGLFGASIGVIRTMYTVPSFITSLALFTMLKGAALMLTNGFPITSFPSWFAFLGSGYVFGIPFPAVVLLAAFLTIHLLMNRTAFGRSLYATGGNMEAARLAGINIGAIRTSAMAITAGLAAMSGIMMSARVMSGTPQAAQGWELDVIAAVIIGGTSLTGGIGTVWGTLVGVLFVGVIGNGMTMLNVPVYAQYVIRGFLIFAAVLTNRLQIQKALHVKHVGNT